MDQEQDDRRPDLSDEPPSKKQRLIRPRLTPLINPNGVDEQQQANEQQQQEAGRKRKRRSRKASKKSRKSRRKSRRSRR